MNEVWILSVKTSLPNVRYNADILQTSFSAYSSFEKARDGLRKILRDFAFSKNAMFDSEGNMIYMKKYMDEIEDYEDTDWDGWLDRKTGAKILALFGDIFCGKDTTLDLESGIYEDGMIQFEVKGDSIHSCGTDDGPINGYDPMISTNMISMQEEKDYYLYLNDMFGNSEEEASAELYIDLQKVEVQ